MERRFDDTQVHPRGEVMRQLVLTLLAACGRVPLPEVPIVDGTESQRQAARDELEAFDLAVTSGRVELVEVRFEPMEWLGGHYSHSRETISLREDLPPSEIPLVLRHELCHAIEYQNRMLSGSDPVFDAWADHILSNESLIAHDLVPDNARDVRGEVMAYSCQEGPSASLLMSTGCTPSSEPLRDVGDWLRDRVWHGETELDEDSAWVVSDVRGAWAPPAGTDIDVLQAFGAQSQDAALLVFSTEVDAELTFIDLRTGERLETLSSDTTYTSTVAPIPTLPEGLRVPDLYQGGDIIGAHHVTDGVTAVALAQGQTLEKLDTVLSQRILVHDGDGPWSIAGGLCLPDALASVFLANGRFYVAWAENGEIRWSEIVRANAD